jgi:DNA primase
MIPDEEVDRVLDAADIIAIIGERIKLKRVGNSWRGPCPFHQGKGDNFSIMPGRGYRCWVCGETGSVFTFVQKQLGMDFVEAVKYVGAKSGIEVREVTRRVEGPDPREPLWECVAAASEFFQRSLWESPEGAAAREYLVKRNIERDVAERFALGYSPRGATVLRAHLETLGFAVERQIQAGVLKAGEGNEEPRVRFRGRLMFPIHDARGRAVGFGGRSIDGGEPKYINSAESAIYSKGQLLYHLHEARFGIRKAERVLLVEGYIDVVRTVAAGFEEVVAPLGTALTADQAKLIRRYTPNVFLMYDSDTAGLKATFRAGDILVGESASVRVVTLPPGEDPDTFVAKAGAAGLEKELRGSIDVFDRKLQLLQRGGWFDDLTRSRKAIDRLLPTIRAAKDPVTRDLYLSRAAQASGVDKETLAKEAASTPATALAVEPRKRVAPRRNGRDSAPPIGLQAERALIRAMLADPASIDATTEALAAIDEEAMNVDPDARPTLRDSTLREIHHALLEADGQLDVARIAEGLSPAAVETLEDLIGEQSSVVNLSATIEDSIKRLKIRWRNERIATLRAGTNMADRDRVNAETLSLKKEIQSLSERPSGAAPH